MKIKIPCCCSVAEGECNRVWPHDTASGHWVNSQRLFSPRGFHDSSTDSHQHEPMLSHLQLNIYCHDWGSPTNCGDVMSCSCKTLHSKTIRSKCAEQSCSCGVYMIKCSADSLLCSQADQNTIKKKKVGSSLKCAYSQHFLKTHRSKICLWISTSRLHFRTKTGTLQPIWQAGFELKCEGTVSESLWGGELHSLHVRRRIEEMSFSSRTTRGLSRRLGLCSRLEREAAIKSVRVSEWELHVCSHPSLVHQWASREVPAPAPPPPALCGRARVQKHDLIQEANSPGNWQADTQPLTWSVAQKATQRWPHPLHRPKHDGSLQFIHGHHHWLDAYESSSTWEKKWGNQTKYYKKNVSSGQLQMHLMFPPHWAMLGQVGASMMLLWTRPDDVTVMSCVSS